MLYAIVQVEGIKTKLGTGETLGIFLLRLSHQTMYDIIFGMCITGMGGGGGRGGWGKCLI